MNIWLLIASLLVVLIILFVTLQIGMKSNQSEYNTKKSAQNLSFIYLIVVPLLIVVLGLVFFFV